MDTTLIDMTVGEKDRSSNNSIDEVRNVEAIGHHGAHLLRPKKSLVLIMGM